MTYMLDTNICIYAIKNKPEQVLRRLKDNLPKGLCISAITLAELEHGVEKSVNPEKNQMALIQFLAILDILPFDDLAATEYPSIFIVTKNRLQRYTKKEPNFTVHI